MSSQVGISSRQFDDAEGRLSLQEVPEKISRIFFGDNSQGVQIKEALHLECHTTI